MALNYTGFMYEPLVFYHHPDYYLLSLGDQCSQPPASRRIPLMRSPQHLASPSPTDAHAPRIGRSHISRGWLQLRRLLRLAFPCSYSSNLLSGIYAKTVKDVSFGRLNHRR